MSTLPATADFTGVPPQFLLFFKKKQVVPDDIVRLEAVGNYTRFVLTEGRKILTSKNLSMYESQLPATFVRVHKSSLINISFIAKHNLKAEILMKDGATVKISRRKRGSFNRFYQLVMTTALPLNQS